MSFKKEIKIINPISPEKIIHNGDVYRIMSYPKQYFIKGYKVTLINEKIYDVHINGKHPNAEPSTGKFCLPYQLKQLEFNDSTKQLLEIVLSHYNLDDCYFTPWNEIQYKKQEV